MRHLLVFLLAVSGLLPLRLAAQPTRVWERTYDRAGGSYYAALPLRTGVTLHVGGYTNDAYDWVNLILTAVNDNGDTVRVVQVRNPVGRFHFPSDAVLEADRSVTVLGVHALRVPGTSRYDYTTFLLQLDTLGRVRWQRSYTPNDVAGTGRLLRLPDGYLLASNADPVPGASPALPLARLLRTDRAGNLLWQRRYPSRGFQGLGYLQGLTACPDGSYLAVGFCDQPNPANPPVQASAYFRRSIWAVRLRPDGDTLQTAVLGTDTEREDGRAVVPTPDGGFAIAGVQGTHRGNSPTPPEDGYLLKTDAQLRPLWSQSIPVSRAACDVRFVWALAAGGLVMGGRIYWPSPTGPNPVWQGHLAAFSVSGAPQWSVLREHGYFEAGYEYGLLRADGTLLLSGYTTPNPNNRNADAALFTRYAGVGAPYQPDPCAAPPAPEFTWARPAPDSLVVLDISLPGPQYAVGAAWRWDFGDGSPAQEGRALARHRYAQPPAAATPVTLAYTNSLGCTRSVTLYPFRPAPLRPSAALAATLRLFPNPAGGARRVTVLARAGAGGPATLRLLDPVGRLVRTVAARPAPDGALRQELELSGLPAGLYLVQLVTDQGTAAQRLLLE
ncbi:T9SS type A sorting domain-containing protein [Hymenobacter gummosus]|uniref:T9SS type A sorting domain-containing protein n=1 Tax=Hymenobacter gummosus TaxID=1776032 RepID=A0A3S0K3R6_9BACT|nr:T9SS type A sorting domain-containing protein [Hymenobacter gummosus]RTQ48097.1 T9SS type A sorting domain-containing protein [Hymenobacter gummosus]